MAKKKAEVPVVETQIVAPVEEVDVEQPTEEKVEKAVIEQPEIESGVDEKEIAKQPEAQEPVVKETQVNVDEIPDNVKNILRAFSNQPKLYVSTAGRVYLPGTKPSIRGNAILYKNPFYNSKS